MSLEMIPKNPRNSLGLDISLILENLTKNKGEVYSTIVELYLQKYTIKDICKTTTLSRYKVNKILKEGLTYLKETLKKEGYNG